MRKHRTLALAPLPATAAPGALGAAPALSAAPLQKAPQGAGGTGRLKTAEVA